MYPQPQFIIHFFIGHRKTQGHQRQGIMYIVVTNHISARLNVYTLYNYSLKGHFPQRSPSACPCIHVHIHAALYISQVFEFTHMVFQALLTDLFDISMISIDILPRLGNTVVKQERWKSHISPHMCSYTCTHALHAVKCTCKCRVQNVVHTVPVEQSVWLIKFAILKTQQVFRSWVDKISCMYMHSNDHIHT